MQYGQRYRNDKMLQKAIQEGELVFSHEHNEWTTGPSGCQYLHWLHGYYTQGNQSLCCGMYSPHIAVTKNACTGTKNRVRVHSTWNDWRMPAVGLSGFRKPEAPGEKQIRSCIDQDGDPTMQDSVAMIVDVWKSIGQDEKLDAWDLQPEQHHLYCFSRKR
jgi:hypothetical protein